MLPLRRVLYTQREVLMQNVDSNVQCSCSQEDKLAYVKLCYVTLENMGKIQLLELFLKSVW